MLMFPQLIAAPILRFHTIARQLKRRVALAPMFNAFRLNLSAFTNTDPVLGESALMLEPSYGRHRSATA
jgi:hypothetical protein